jgi:6-phospho-beta-glucosidase
MSVGRVHGHGGGLARANGRAVVAVLGGTSVGTPALIRALAAARQAGRLPDLELRLFGRALARGQRLIEYAATRVPLTGTGSDAAVLLRLAPELPQALAGSDIVVCQVRPGGMGARAEDEMLAIAEGVPGDEGLGPSGLASFLRGRPLMDAIAEAWSRLAPAALFLQLTSPLGLTVARGARHGGGVLLGLCELPATTSAAIRTAVGPHLGPVRHAHYGLNHCSWLHAFTDADGSDRTDAVIDLADRAGLLPVEPSIARRERAIPVHYLRLFYHPDRALSEQRARGRTRGQEVARWCAELEGAYLTPDGPAAAEISALLAQRRMDWYDEAVVPAVVAWCGNEPVELVLNVTGVEPEVAVELPCRVAHGEITPRPQPALPEGPRSLFRRLAGYERAALALPSTPTLDRLAEVLGLHPLVPDGSTAVRLGRRILARLGVPDGRPAPAGAII